MKNSIKVILSLLGGSLLFCFVQAQPTGTGNNTPVISPIPQKMTAGHEQVPFRQFYLYGAEEADRDAVGQLRQLAPVSQTKRRAYAVYIGEKEDKAVKKYADRIPPVSGGYYLSISPEKTIIAGNDECGTFYAVQTLKQLLHAETLPTVEITDYPSIAYRGTVEGFYGQPWSHRNRIEQLKFYGANKLNTYIYGPKDDPYHSSPNWRLPYPEKEATQLQELVKIAKANKVNFVWAIHPGQDIRWNTEDKNLLLHKFELMYQLGVRSFAVFFDDISGEGTDPEKQADLLNFLHHHFVQAKQDVTPLIMCPTQYNKSWSDPKPGTYLDILGEKLDPSIQIMWTGDRVISDITVNGLEWIDRRIKRPAYVWWNFPVNDYVRNHLLLGRAYGLDTSASSLMSGFVSNPMERAEASKIAIFCVADYAWNPSRYNSHLSWENAIRNLLPDNAEALRTFAEHNSDLGPNGHGYRREESVTMKPIIDQALANLKQNTFKPEQYWQIRTEYEKIQKAADRLIKDRENPDFIAEILPWLKQFELLGQAGIAATDLLLQIQDSLVTENILWGKYAHLLNLLTRQKQIDKTQNQNPYQPGVKTGSLVMQPFVDHNAEWLGQQFYERLSPGNTNREQLTSVTPQLLSDIAQLKTVPLQTTEYAVAITPLLETVALKPEQYIGIQLPFELNSGNLEINLNDKTLQEWSVLETSTDGKTWTPLQPAQQKTILRAQLQNNKARYIRLRNAGKTIRTTHLKKWVLTSEQFSGKKGNVFRAMDGDLATTYLLQGTSEFKNVSGTRPEEILLLFSPEAYHAVQIIPIGKSGKRYPEKISDSAFVSLSLKAYPEEIGSIELVSKQPAYLHEVIW